MNLSFIKLDINILNDTKIKVIRKMPDGDNMFVLWVGILCLGMKSGRPGVLEIGENIPFTDEILSDELDIPLNTVKLGLEMFERLRMVEKVEEGTYLISNFEKHQELEKIENMREKERQRKAKYREKLALGLSSNQDVPRDKTGTEQGQDEDVPMPSPECPATDKNKNKTKNKNKSIYTGTDLEEIIQFAKDQDFKPDFRKLLPHISAYRLGTVLEEMSFYSKSEVKEAITNYIQIMNDQDNYKLGFRYQDLLSFLEKGINLFINDSDPFTVYRKNRELHPRESPQDSYQDNFWEEVENHDRS
ncbi:phage replisome organizer N-terminal domain-containing protein [Spirochaeta cellobiosiphila]|uniref:phage replisome organizer N-terminal domain-containing protein n=1 Tax=Spirochaeta cellobiosiphila TaxID=504483 RepID=UPI0004040A7C|nr:phage replisome organizer N-terminal domain-containing protein [Spirochaeta cellobiosiphila]